MFVMGKIIYTAAIAAMLPLSMMIAEPVMANASVMEAAPKKEVKTVVFNVGLHCQNRVKKVRENISFEKGVKSLEINLEKKTVTISYDPAKTNEETLKKAIEKLGYTCGKPE